MIIVPKKNLYLPERIWGRPRFQRGIIQLAAAYGARPSPPPGLVTLSGETIGASGAGQQECYVEVRSNGQMRKFTTTGGLLQIDAGTDWIIPNGAASAEFDCRYTNLGGDALDTEPAGEDVWVDVSVGRLYGYIDNTSSPGSLKAGTIELQIRWRGGPILDTGSYIMSANRTS